MYALFIYDRKKFTLIEGYNVTGLTITFKLTTQLLKFVISIGLGRRHWIGPMTIARRIVSSIGLI